MECEYAKDKLSEALVLARTRSSDLESVKKLNFWGSGIRDVSVVKELPNLEVCSLSVNCITTLKDFGECENLKELFIRKNKIEDLTEICHLKTLPNLRNLWLADNPCDQSENYRYTVLKTLPNLQKLDNIAVNEDELKQAEDLGEELFLDEDDCKQDDEENNENGEESKPDVSEENDNPEVSKENDKPESNNGTNTDNKESVKQSENDTAKKTSSKPSGAINSKKEKGERKKETSVGDSMLDPVTMSWEETNRIREELGLKPLPIEKMTSPKPVPSSKEKSRNAHVLQAVLILLRELDKDCLEIVQSTIQKKLDSGT